MSISQKTVLFAAALAVLPIAVSIDARSQDANVRNVEQFSCKDVMRESGSARENAIAFLHGYILGRSDGTEFELEVFAEQTDAFVEHCLDNPDDGALESMAKVKG